MSVDRSFVKANNASRERLRATIARLSDDDLRKEGPDGWSVAAGLAHLAFYDRRALVLLNKWTKAGEAPAPSPIDVDIVNDAAHFLVHLIPPRAAANEAVAAAEATDRALEDLTDELLTAISAANAVRLDRSTHRIDHVEQIESLVSQVG